MTHGHQLYVSLQLYSCTLTSFIGGVHAAVQSDRESEHERELQRVPDHFGARTTEELKKSYC